MRSLDFPVQLRRPWLDVDVFHPKRRSQGSKASAVAMWPT
jgi:hypothetical protein